MTEENRQLLLEAYHQFNTFRFGEKFAGAKRARATICGPEAKYQAVVNRFHTLALREGLVTRRKSDGSFYYLVDMSQI